jgi:hypothetical protein
METTPPLPCVKRPSSHSLIHFVQEIAAWWLCPLITFLRLFHSLNFICNIQFLFQLNSFTIDIINTSGICCLCWSPHFHNLLYLRTNLDLFKNIIYLNNLVPCIYFPVKSISFCEKGAKVRETHYLGGAFHL